jgi:predicted DNA-binding transcriptional regulator YafY
MDGANQPMEKIVSQHTQTACARPPALDAYTVEFHRRSIRIALRYRGTTGRTSERTVSVQRLIGHVQGEDVIYDRIQAMCELRGMTRAFLLSGIELASDPETGEIIEDVGAWLAPKGIHH